MTCVVPDDVDPRQRNGDLSLFLCERRVEPCACLFAFINFGIRQAFKLQASSPENLIKPRDQRTSISIEIIKDTQNSATISQTHSNLKVNCSGMVQIRKVITPVIIPSELG